MRRGTLLELGLAFALKRVLGPSHSPPRSAEAAEQGGPAPGRREPLALVALAALVAGALLLIVFDEWFTRLPGVLALFAFIVAGVFVIASPPFLEQEREEGQGWDASSPRR